MFLVTILIFLIVFLLTVYYYYSKFYNSVQRYHAKSLQGPEPQWIFGNLKNSGVISGDLVFHEVLDKFKQTYGDAYSFWFGPQHSIVLSRLEYVQHVLMNRQIYDMSTQTTSIFGVLFPNGLIALRGDAWKRHARFILPMFKRAKIVPYLDTIVTCIDRLIDKQFVKQDGQIHTDLVSQSQNALLNIIAFIAFDYDLDASTDSDSVNLRKAFNDFVHCANQFLLFTGIPIWIAKIMLFLNRKFQQALRTMKHYVMNIITEEQKRRKDDGILSNRAKNLIASLVSSIKNESSSSKAFLTPQEVFDEVSMSILAGFETTSTVISWFIFYMSKYPDVQKKIKDEIREHGITYETPLTQDILDSLVYVECVTKEILRFAPIVSSISRVATCDDIIDGIPVEKGDTIIIAIQNLHHDPRYWNIDPTKFIPERFLNEDKNPSQYAYLPFGGGHRACAGQDLAFFELKVVITRLMQRVTFEDPGAEANNSGGYVQRITCFPKNVAVRVRVNSNKKTD